MEETKNTEEQKPKKKSKKWIWAVVGLFLIIAIASAGGGGDEENATDQTAVAAWASAEVTEESVRDALAGKPPVNPSPKDLDFPKSITDISVINNVEGNKNVMIYYKSGDAWDETDFVKQVGSTAIIASSILFENPKVDQVGVFAATDMTDQYGNTNTETVAKIIIGRDTADKIDWKGFAERHITDPGNIYRIADDYNIHLGILKNVKLDEVQIK